MYYPQPPEGGFEECYVQKERNYNMKDKTFDDTLITPYHRLEVPFRGFRGKRVR